MHDTKMRVETDPRASDESSRMRQTWAEVARQPRNPGSSSGGEEYHEEGERKGKKAHSSSSKDNHDGLVTSSKVEGRTRPQHDKTTTVRNGSMTRSERKADQKREKRMRVEPMPSDDESWCLISKQKPGPKRSVLYIGNLSPETTEERLVNFIQARSTAVGVKPPNVINSRMFESRDGTERIGARLTVASSDAGVLQATNFWPRPTYARLWNFNIVRLEKPELLPLESHSNSSKCESAAAPAIA